jgi:heterodisulfide reductase subunit B
VNFSYYPGCTLHSTGVEFGASARAVLDALGVELKELDDWNCCGATSGHSMGHELGVLLAGRNLLIAQQTGMELLVPCVACYSRLRHAQHALSENLDWQKKLGSTVGIAWKGGAVVESALSIVANKIPAEEITQRVKRQLKGLKVVPYYGCLLARPRTLTDAPNPDYPMDLDQLLVKLGAEVMEWSYKTDCCGASLSLTRSEQVVRLVGKLVDKAVEAGADCIATACPMCQANLEMRQGNRQMPVFYFTELMGLAFGLNEAGKWWSKHIIDPRPLLRRIESAAV